jgi:glycosyltransferase involved in cell wall biosynthesis
VKILLVHEHYRSDSPSGEDAMFRAEHALLARAGHSVVTYEVHNDSIGPSAFARARVAADTVWSASTARAMARLLARERPDVAHFHNTFPLISPSGYAACQRAGVPVLQTLHNYRLICPGGLLLRAGAPCEACVGTSLLPALRHACYRGSRPATAAVVAMLLAHRALGSYRRDVDRYLVLTEFARDLFVRGGLPADRLVVRPNGLTDDPGPGRGDGGHALFVGRLSAEKGVATLVAAWRRDAPLPLLIVGDGPQREELERAADGHPSIRFLGAQPRTRVYELLGAASVLVMPSECYEGLPVTFMEALACGTPVAAARIGALGVLMEDGVHGVHFPPRSPAALSGAVRRLVSDPGALAAIRVRNRALFESRYSPTAALRSLEENYRAVLAAR